MCASSANTIIMVVIIIHANILDIMPIITAPAAVNVLIELACLCQTNTACR